MNINLSRSGVFVFLIAAYTIQKAMDLQCSSMLIDVDDVFFFFFFYVDVHVDDVGLALKENLGTREEIR